MARLSLANLVKFRFSWIKLGLAGVVLAALAAAAIYLYHQGREAGKGISSQRITEYENKIRELNAQNKEKETQVIRTVIREYHTREIVRTKVEYKNRDVIRTVVPEQFKLSKGWLHAHDQSAKGEEIDPKLAADPNPSDVSDKQALVVIDENYNLANRTADRLEALQKAIRELGLAEDVEKK